jgi:hypothetical protein
VLIGLREIGSLDVAGRRSPRDVEDFSDFGDAGELVWGHPSEANKGVRRGFCSGVDSIRGLT